MVLDAEAYGFIADREGKDGFAAVRPGSERQGVEADGFFADWSVAACVR